MHVKFVTFLKTSYKGVRRHNTTTQRLGKLANLLLLIKLEKNKLIHSRHVTMYLYFANTRIYFIQCTEITFDSQHHSCYKSLHKIFALWTRKLLHSLHVISQNNCILRYLKKHYIWGSISISLFLWQRHFTNIKYKNVYNNIKNLLLNAYVLLYI